jgi:hypothetical protein
MGRYLGGHSKLGQASLQSGKNCYLGNGNFEPGSPLIHKNWMSTMTSPPHYYIVREEDQQNISLAKSHIAF